MKKNLSLMLFISILSSLCSIAQSRVTTTVPYLISARKPVLPTLHYFCRQYFELTDITENDSIHLDLPAPFNVVFYHPHKFYITDTISKYTPDKILLQDTILAHWDSRDTNFYEKIPIQPLRELVYNINLTTLDNKTKTISFKNEIIDSIQSFSIAGEWKAEPYIENAVRLKGHYSGVLTDSNYKEIIELDGWNDTGNRTKLYQLSEIHQKKPDLEIVILHCGPHDYITHLPVAYDRCNNIFKEWIKKTPSFSEIKTQLFRLR